MIRIDEKTVGIWFARISDDCDWLSHMAETGQDSFEVCYRLRYYGRQDADDIEGSRKWYKGNFNAPRQDAIERMRALASKLAATTGAPVDEILMRAGDVEAFQREIDSHPGIKCSRIATPQANTTTQQPTTT
jgi:hypothetical protein